MAAAAIAAIGLGRGARWGRGMALVTAGAVLYLAGIDILFDLENGVSAGPIADGRRSGDQRLVRRVRNLSTRGDAARS